MARAALLAILLGLWSPRVGGETSREAVSPPHGSLNAGSTPAFTQSPPSLGPSGPPITAVIPGVADQTVARAMGRNPGRQQWPPVRDTGRVAPAEIFVPPKGTRGFGCVPIADEVRSRRIDTPSILGRVGTAGVFYSVADLP
jgi:hypothetical protein